MTMKTKKLLLITPILLLVMEMMGGCGKHCPGFPDEYVDYFPYTEGETVKFTNADNDTIAFEVTGVLQVKEHKISTCGMCECDPPAVFLSLEPTIKDSFIGKVAVVIDLSEDSKAMSFYFGFFYNKEIFEPNSDYLTYTIPINTLQDTVIIDEPNPKRISKLTLVKGKGIISFYDIINQSEWIAIND